MEYWIFMFFCNILIPVIMIIFGWVMYKHPPKEINSLYGYRTSKSMKNQESWDFAQKCCGNLWLKMGIVVLIISILLQIPFIKNDDNTISILSCAICTVQLVPLVVSIICVERALKKEFEESKK